MRAFIVVLALVATPFLAAASQTLKEPNCDNGLGDEHRSLTGTLHAHKGLCATQPPLPDADQDGVPDILDECPNTPPGTTVDASGCPVQPPTGCVNSSPGTGTGAVAGQVFVDDPAQEFPYVAGWCVELRDGSGAVIATTVTSGVALDMDGSNWVITGVPAGTYTVCEVLPPHTTWRQTFPTSGPDCGGGVIGMTTMVVAGGTSGFIWFGNLP
jgi:hypothetical protein